MHSPVPWDLIESGLVDPLADPHRLHAVRTTLDPYEVLELQNNATREEVTAAYRALARTHHPDRGGDTQLFQQLAAARDALVGVGVDSVVPYGGLQCPSRSPTNMMRKDVVRCILVAPDWGWLTLDEKEVVVMNRETRRVAMTAPLGVSLLCCCFLDDHRRLAVGGTKGELKVVSLRVPTNAESGAYSKNGTVPLSSSGTVYAVAAPSGDQSPLLLCSVDGAVLLIDLDDFSVLCALSVAVAGLQVEALLCPSVPELDDENVFPPEPVFILGGGNLGAGALSCVRIRAACAEGAQEGALLLWTAGHELPVFALSACPTPATASRSPNPTVSLVAAASGSTVVLHEAATGVALRQLSAGRDGVLYALAVSPCGATLLTSGSEEVVHAFNLPAGTRRAVIRLTRSGWAGGLNTATVNALAFVDEAGFVSGGYDAAVTRWQLTPPTGPFAPLKLDELSVEELRSLIVRAGLSASDLTERKDLHERALQAQVRLAHSQTREMASYFKEAVEANRTS